LRKAVSGLDVSDKFILHEKRDELIEVDRLVELKN
jgi:hypothetical protein